MKARKGIIVVLLLVMAIVLAGCCENPGATDQAGKVLHSVQAFYGPVSQAANAIAEKPVLPGSQDAKVQAAVVAADSALLLAGTLQAQYCASQGQVTQAQLQAAQAKATAEAAGLK